uniref:Acetylglutamate kinase n=1 Tax=Inkyuleea mariana TaxID=123988 RepID=A0A4D6X2F7_9FLOR|nr:acetylglutamate kinase [Inkyuleea mariana]
MLNNLERVQILSEILPFIKKLSGSIIVIKYGGAAMKNKHLKYNVIQDVLFLHSIGIKPILVHGGGPLINNWLKKINIEPKFENGIRITDLDTMEIVEMVLVGQVNKSLVHLFNQQNNCAVGLCGKDGNLIQASKLFPSSDNFVGKIDVVDPTIINLLLDSGYIPVVASTAGDNHNQTYNINADTAAGAIAKSLNAEKLVLLTDTPGIMLDMNNPKTLIKDLDIRQVNKLRYDKIISGGMIPKIECCIDVLKANVKSTHIIDGRIEHSLLLEILTADRIGSMITY